MYGGTLPAKLRVTGSIGVLLLAGAVVVWREASRETSEAPAQTRAPQVVMFVDLAEGDEVGACGEIIHDVREAARRGIATEEIDARDPGTRAEHYKLLVAPAVLILDASGREVRRFESEAPQTIAAIREELARLPPR